jgi:hypothetical protein
MIGPMPRRIDPRPLIPENSTASNRPKFAPAVRYPSCGKVWIEFWVDCASCSLRIRLVADWRAHRREGRKGARLENHPLALVLPEMRGGGCALLRLPWAKALTLHAGLDVVILSKQRIPRPSRAAVAPGGSL